jgi:hypothetical protein
MREELENGPDLAYLKIYTIKKPFLREKLK